MTKRLVAWDTETFLLNTEYPEPYGYQGQAPIPVCLSWRRSDRKRNEISNRPGFMTDFLMKWLNDDQCVMVGHNIAYDFAVVVKHLDIPLQLVLDKYNKGLVRDTMLRETLLDLATGEAVKNPSKQYSLQALTKQYLGKDTSADKGEDAWRMRYSELYGVPLKDWPEDAVRYPKDDAEHTLKVFAHQQKQKQWFQANERAQTRAAMDLHLLAMNTPRVNPEQIDIFEQAHIGFVQKAQAPFIAKGILKPNKHRYKQFEKGDPRREGYSMDTKTLAKVVQRDYERQGLEVPKTPKGAVSLAGDTLLACSNRLLREYGEAAGDIKLVDAFIPGLRKAAGSHGSRATTRYGVILKTGRTSCVKFDTPILTEQGYKPIWQIKVGDKVWTHERRWRPVTETYIYEPQTMYRVKFSTGTEITCTIGHKVYTTDDTWITVEELINDRKQALDKRPEEYRRCSETLQTGESSLNSTRDSSSSEQHSSQCGTCSQAVLLEGGASDVEIGEDSGQEVRRFESHEGANGERSSELRRGLRDGAGVHDATAQRQEAVRSSSDHGSGVGFGGAAQAISRSPYQRGRDGQSHRQPSTGNSSRALRHTRLAGEGREGVDASEISVRGVFGVYDISVEEDESYFAGGVFNHNSSKINMQQMPKAPGARECFIPEDGHVFVAIDYSSMEMYCLAQMMWLLYGTRKLLDVLNSGQDPHLMAVEDISGMSYERMDDLKKDKDPLVGKWRALGKIANFGFAGGMGAGTATSNLAPYERETIEDLFPDEEVIEVMGRLQQVWRRKWELMPFFNHVGGLCQGGSRPTYTCPITGRIKALNTYCQMCNMHFQPIAADCLKEAIRLVTESSMIEGGLLHDHGVKISIEIHDELVLSGPPEGLREWVPEVQRLMKQGAETFLPDCVIKTEAEVCGDRWSKEGVEIEEYYELEEAGFKVSQYMEAKQERGKLSVEQFLESSTD